MPATNQVKAGVARCRIPGLLLLGCTLLPGFGHAAMYKWVNSQGEVVYSQSPPDNGAPARLIAPPPPPATPPGTAEKNLLDLRQQLEDSREDRQMQAEKAQKQAAKQAQNQKNCDNARHNQRMLEEHAHALFRSSNGDYRRYTEEQRQAELEKLSTFLNKECQ